MLSLILLTSTADIVRLALSGKEDSLIMILKESVSPSDFILTFDALMENRGNRRLIEEILRLGREKFGRRFMVTRAFNYYLSTRQLDKALRELNYMYSPQQIALKLGEIEDIYGESFWNLVSGIEDIRSPFRKGTILYLVRKGDYGKALSLTREISDTLFLAKLLFDRGKYELVVHILSPVYGRSKEATLLYGKSLFHLGRYQEAGPVLEKVDPALSSRAYRLSGNLKKALRVHPDTSFLIEYYFRRGNVDTLLNLCQTVLSKECIAAVLTSSPDSLQPMLMEMAIKAKEIRPEVGILLQVVQKYGGDTAVRFLENVLMGKKNSLPKEILYLSLALYGELHKDTNMAIENYSNVVGWAEPFALYRLFVLTGSEKFRRLLLDKYPQTAYSAMVSP